MTRMNLLVCLIAGFIMIGCIEGGPSPVEVPTGNFNENCTGSCKYSNPPIRCATGCQCMPQWAGHGACG